LDNDLPWDSEALPTTELASVEECSQPECRIGRPLATMRLVRVERCFQSVFTGTSLHGGELRGGVAASLGGVLVANIARRGQAPPWREIAPAILILVPFGTGPGGGTKTPSAAAMLRRFTPKQTTRKDTPLRRGAEWAIIQWSPTSTERSDGL